MFTGIIQDIGIIDAIAKDGDWVVTIHVPKLPLAGTPLGASISCSGVCLTVIEKEGQHFKVQISMESLSKTTAIRWQVGGRINIEPALRVGDELGGHYVSGHVDGIARLTGKHTEADSLRLVFEVPPGFAKYIAAKGSVSIDGVSLTVNAVDDSSFGVNIIPYTQTETTLGALTVGDEANFEIDMIARYVERMIGKRSVA